MDFDVSIVVATYGDSSWAEMANDRAVPSALAQGVEVVPVHLPGGTLAQARNEGLARVESEFVIFLDADDWLAPDYVERMATGSADLRAPSIAQYRYGKPLWPAFMPQVFRHAHVCEADCLRVGNWLVIGTAARTSILHNVGGWEEFAWSEDWQLWAKAWKAGASVEAIPEAVYHANLGPSSRNHQFATFQMVQIHQDIEMSVWGDLVDPRQHPARTDRVMA